MGRAATAQCRGAGALWGRLPNVSVRRLPSGSAFVVVDLDGAARSDGVVRWAKKILVDGASWLARSRTYAWASLGEQIGGASAGISAVPDERQAALDAFVADTTELVSSGELTLEAGKGVSWADLAPLRAVDGRGPLATDDDAPELAADLLASGVTAATAAQLGGLDGRTITLEGPPEVTGVLAAAFGAQGASVIWTDGDSALALSATADALVCGSKVGLLDHQQVTEIGSRLIVPWGPMPVTTRAVAVARRAGIEVLPDFVTTAGPLLASTAADGVDAEALRETAADTVGGIIGEVSGHDDGPLLGACLRAEAFLATWRDDLPFGRPIA